MDPSTHSSAPVQDSAASPTPLQYTSAGLTPVAPLPRRTGAVDPTTHSSAPVQYSAAAPAPVQYSAALQPLAPATSAVFTAPTASPWRQTPAPATANLATCVAHAALQPLAPATSRSHVPPAPPVALGATNGRTTLRSYAKLTKTLISTLKTSTFKTKTLISTPKTTISTPESIMPTSVYLQPRGFREVRLPCFYSLSLRLTLAVSTPVVSFRSTHHSVCIV